VSFDHFTLDLFLQHHCVSGLSQTHCTTLGQDTLRLSQNSIGGPIPEALYNLTFLESLELSDMNLTGTLSTRIGNLERLYNFRCRHNMLSGSIPTELARLSQLRKYCEAIVCAKTYDE